MTGPINQVFVPQELGVVIADVHMINVLDLKLELERQCARCKHAAIYLFNFLTRQVTFRNMTQQVSSLQEGATDVFL
jgi:hypothetical protein